MRGLNILTLKRESHKDFVLISFLCCSSISCHFIYYLFFDFLFLIEYIKIMVIFSHKIIKCVSRITWVYQNHSGSMIYRVFL